jgi:THUMP domain-like/Methyltransferase domain
MDVETFRELLRDPGPVAVARAVAALDAGSQMLAVASAVRRDFPELSPAVASAAVTQATLRRRARAKFGAVADGLWLTREGLEQSTGTPIADHRAKRFADLASRLGRRPRVADLCCGIGGDLRALAAAGCEVTGYDADSVAAAVAAANTRNTTASVECLDVEALDLSDLDAAFIDPARRSDGRRTFDVAAYKPGWPFVLSVLTQLPAAAAKVAPGIAHDLVPPGVEVEWISVSGALKEAVLWSGTLTDGTLRRRATLLPVGATLTSNTAADELPPTGQLRRYLYEPDDAVVRAHLIGDLARSLDGVLLDASTAYITSDTLVATPFAQVFEVDDAMPFSLKRLRTALRERKVGAATIMKRGSAIDVEQLRRDLKLSGDAEAVVVLALIDGRHYAVITHQRR